MSIAEERQLMCKKKNGRLGSLKLSPSLIKGPQAEVFYVRRWKVVVVAS
jgi:hypothetical protein